MNLSRQRRREIRAQAKKIAHDFARTAQGGSVGGELVPVKHPTAIAALNRAFLHMLSNGLNEHVTKLSYRDGATFPGSTGIEGQPWYLAVGIDVEMKLAYRIEQIRTNGAPPMEAEIINRTLALDRLKPLTSKPGFAGAGG